MSELKQKVPTLKLFKDFRYALPNRKIAINVNCNRETVDKIIRILTTVKLVVRGNHFIIRNLFGLNLNVMKLYDTSKGKNLITY